MGALWIIRIICLVSVVLFSFVVAALSAFYLSKFDPFDLPGLLSETVPAWAVLSLLVAAFSIFLIIPMLIIDFVRKGAVTSRIIVELIVFSVLSALWLAAAADTAAEFDLSFLRNFDLPETCSGLLDSIPYLERLALSDPLDFGDLLQFNFDSVGILCHSHDAIEILGFLSWIFLMGYAITLLICALIAKYRGHPAIWTSTVRNTNFLGRYNNQTPTPKEEIVIPGPMATMQQQNNYYASNQGMKVVSQNVTPASTGATMMYLPQV